MITPEELRDLCYRPVNPLHPLVKLRRLCIMWEAAYRRRKGGMWPAMNRGQAGCARASRLLEYLNNKAK